MFLIDQLTIILGAIAIISALITPFFNPFFRRLKHQEKPAVSSTPGVTVLLVSNGDATALDEHLPIYLTQDYDKDYQVIVVAEKSDTETGDVLKRYANDPHLYFTFIPETSRYMSKNKLAITLGVKASKHDWIILSDSRLKPTSNQWLQSLAQSLGDDTSIVLGYCNYADEAPSFHRFEHLHTALYLLRDAQTGRAYRTNCLQIAFRKNEFMRQSGFMEYLRYSIGEFEFLVNKFSREDATVVATDESTWLVENPLPNSTWKNRQVYYQEVRRHLEGGMGVRLLRGIDQLLLHANYLFILGVGIFGGLTQRWVLVGAASLALILTIVLRTIIGRKAMREFKVDIPAYKIVPLEISLWWRHIRTCLRYEYADKKDFISHKV